MICPECGAEYVPGFTRCSDCLVLLVDKPPEPPRPPKELKPLKPPKPPKHRTGAIPPGRPFELVTVFRSGDAGRAALAQSILRSASVPFVVCNDLVQNWAGLGPFPAAYNIALGPVEIRVAREDADDARLMVKDLENGNGWADDEADDNGDEDTAVGERPETPEQGDRK